MLPSMAGLKTNDYMSSCVLTLFSNLRPSRSRYVREPTHLMLTGINQRVFLNQWGDPDTQIGLNRIGSFNRFGSLFLTVDPHEEVHHSVWIYKKRDRILFFTKKRLTSHFRWSGFKERWKKSKRKMDPMSNRKASFFKATVALIS